MFKDKFYYIYYSNKFHFFAELCRKGFLDTTNHFILDMYNICIRYAAQELMNDIDFNKLDSLIDDFCKLDYQLYMFMHKNDFKEV